MYNHSNISHNITMIIFLCFFLLIVLFLYSNLKFEIDFSFGNMKDSILHYDYDYSISIIYFKKLKTYSRKKIKELLKKRRNNNSSKMTTTQIYFNFFKSYFRFLFFDNLTTKINIGLLSVITTIYAVPAISTFLSIIYSKYLLKNSNNCSFVVEPVFGKFELLASIHGIISIRIVNIIYILFKIWIERRNKNGRTSNRRSYEYCYE